MLRTILLIFIFGAAVCFARWIGAAYPPPPVVMLFSDPASVRCELPCLLGVHLGDPVQSARSLLLTHPLLTRASLKRDFDGSLIFTSSKLLVRVSTKFNRVTAVTVIPLARQYEIADAFGLLAAPDFVQNDVDLLYSSTLYYVESQISLTVSRPTVTIANFSRNPQRLTLDMKIMAFNLGHDPAPDRRPIHWLGFARFDKYLELTQFVP